MKVPVLGVMFLVAGFFPFTCNSEVGDLIEPSAQGIYNFPCVASVLTHSRVFVPLDVSRFLWHDYNPVTNSSVRNTVSQIPRATVDRLHELAASSDGKPIVRQKKWADGLDRAIGRESVCQRWAVPGFSHYIEPMTKLDEQSILKSGLLSGQTTDPVAYVQVGTYRPVTSICYKVESYGQHYALISGMLGTIIHDGTLVSPTKITLTIMLPYTEGIVELDSGDPITLDVNLASYDHVGESLSRALQATPFELRLIPLNGYVIVKEYRNGFEVPEDYKTPIAHAVSVETSQAASQRLSGVGE